MITLRERCGHCDQTVDFAMNFARRTEAELRIGIGSAFSAAACPICKKPSLFHFSYDDASVTGSNLIEQICSPTDYMHGGRMKEIEVFPKPKRPAVHPEWPCDVVEEFKTVQKIVWEKGSSSLAIAACGAILEVVSKNLGAKGKNLKSKIDWLLAEGLITKSLAEWGQHTRIIRNEAIHELKGTQDEAEECVEFIRILLEVCYSIPDRIAKKARPTT